MTELEMTVEALKRCVPREAFERAMEEVRHSAPPEKKRTLKREEVIQDVLLETGMPGHTHGFQLAVTAVEVMMDKPGALITKEVYPETARRYDIRPGQVERLIRGNIEVAFERGDPDVLDRMFGNSIDPNKEKATNWQYLQGVAMAVKRRMKE